LLLSHRQLQGQLFADIFPIFRDPLATEAVISHLVKRFNSSYAPSQICAIVCLESRGFFFGPLLAARLNLPCIPIRKGGKLPGDVVSLKYQKEYGQDVFEMKTDAFEGVDCHGKHVLLLDDLLGKGGSIIAAKSLVNMLGMEVAEAYFVFDVAFYLEENKKTLGNLPWYAMVHITEENIGPILN
jgi:adenine phosphoribosyltransferase